MQVETNVNLLESIIYEILFHIWCFLFVGRRKVKYICGYEFKGTEDVPITFKNIDTHAGWNGIDITLHSTAI